MSNDRVRVTFPDGTVLYGIGDCSELVSRRLYDTEDAAWAAYCDETIYDPVPDTAYQEPDEDVHLETTYGSPDYSYKDMLAQNARASRNAKLITSWPSLPGQAETF